jgi:hypothetical protein
MRVISKAIKMAIAAGLLKPTGKPNTKEMVKKFENKYPKPKIETATVKKNNTKKFLSIGVSQMRKGRSATILNQSSLLNNKYKIKNKSLLGE